MSVESSAKRNTMLYVYLGVFSTILGVAGLFLFLYLCNLARENVEFASSNPIALKIGRIGYLYSHASVQYACGRYDPELSYLMAPGECVQEEVEYTARMDINSAGLRDDEESLEGPDIVLLGDSHAMGLGVDEDEIFAAIVERESGLKVLNAGVSSFGTAREMLLLRKLDLDRADYVILQYCRNDIDENVAYYEGGGSLDIMSEEDYDRYARLDVERHRKFLSPGLGVVNRVFEKIGETAGSFGSDGNGLSEIEYFKYVLAQNLDALEGKKIILLDLNGHNRYDNRFIENAERALGDLGLDIAFVDPGVFLEDDDFFLLDNHMRPRGHRKVAEALLQALRQDAVQAPAAAQ